MITSADLVARIRQANGDTQEGLARRLAVSYPTINAWERGRSEPTPKHRATLEALAAELDIVHEFVVMVIDDDPVTAALVEAAAIGFGGVVSVHSALNGWEGLVMCGAVQPRLLFLDIMMPGIDGLEVARRLPAIPGLDEMRVVFVTASQSPEILERAAALGNAVLGKPVELDALADVIRTTMEDASPR
ncbi:response regulator [Microbacterium sp. NPDC077184]|uniref:response regulator n=1 Tax=Microbacterium sp. NPDC077184 TaxID=3154764 RepID=UPI003445B6EB